MPAIPWSLHVDNDQRRARRSAEFLPKRRCVKCASRLSRQEYPALFCASCLWPNRAST